MYEKSVVKNGVFYDLVHRMSNDSLTCLLAGKISRKKKTAYKNSLLLFEQNSRGIFICNWEIPLVYG